MDNNLKGVMMNKNYIKFLVIPAVILGGGNILNSNICYGMEENITYNNGLYNKETNNKTETDNIKKQGIELNSANESNDYVDEQSVLYDNNKSKINIKEYNTSIDKAKSILQSLDETSNKVTEQQKQLIKYLANKAEYIIKNDKFNNLFNIEKFNENSNKSVLQNSNKDVLNYCLLFDIETNGIKFLKLVNKSYNDHIINENQYKTLLELLLSTSFYKILYHSDIFKYLLPAGDKIIYNYKTLIDNNISEDDDKKQLYPYRYSLSLINELVQIFVDSTVKTNTIIASNNDYRYKIFLNILFSKLKPIITNCFNNTSKYLDKYYIDKILSIGDFYTKLTLITFADILQRNINDTLQVHSLENKSFSALQTICNTSINSDNYNKTLVNNLKPVIDSIKYFRDFTENIAMANTANDSVNDTFMYSYTMINYDTILKQIMDTMSKSNGEILLNNVKFLHDEEIISNDAYESLLDFIYITWQKYGLDQQPKTSEEDNNNSDNSDSEINGNNAINSDDESNDYIELRDDEYSENNNINTIEKNSKLYYDDFIIQEIAKLLIPKIFVLKKYSTWMPKDELVHKVAKEIYYKHLLVIECLNDKDYISYKVMLKDVHNIDKTWWSKRANYRIKELKKIVHKAVTDFFNQDDVKLVLRRAIANYNHDTKLSRREILNNKYRDNNQNGILTKITNKRILGKIGEYVYDRNTGKESVQIKNNRFKLADNTNHITLDKLNTNNNRINTDEILPTRINDPHNNKDILINMVKTKRYNTSEIAKSYLNDNSEDSDDDYYSSDNNDSDDDS